MKKERIKLTVLYNMKYTIILSSNMQENDKIQNKSSVRYNTTQNNTTQYNTIYLFGTGLSERESDALL